MEAFTYKGISEGKYVEGEIEALNQDEASFKLKEQKVIITNLIKSAKKKLVASAIPALFMLRNKNQKFLKLLKEF